MKGQQISKLLAAMKAKNTASEVDMKILSRWSIMLPPLQ